MSDNKPLEDYLCAIPARTSEYPLNADLQTAKTAFFTEIGIGKANYVYNFTWLGLPVLQIPQDLQALQEMIWELKPDLIIETGIAWGGSLMFSASMLALLEACNEVEEGRVIGIDLDIRSHNRRSISNHPLSKKITMIEGSSIAPEVVSQVKNLAQEYQRVMVCLDSNHTHDHVLAELEAYAPLIAEGGYCMVGDTVIDDAPLEMTSDRPWGPGNSPKSAVLAYLKKLEQEVVLASDGKPLKLEIAEDIENKIVLTGSPSGYLRRSPTK